MASASFRLGRPDFSPCELSIYSVALSSFVATLLEFNCLMISDVSLPERVKFNNLEVATFFELELLCSNPNSQFQTGPLPTTTSIQRRLWMAQTGIRNSRILRKMRHFPYLYILPLTEGRAGLPPCGPSRTSVLRAGRPRPLCANRPPSRPRQFRFKVAEIPLKIIPS